MKTLSKIEQLHALYCELTGFKLSLTEFNRERDWYEFSQKYTAQDLKLVILYLQEGIRKGERRKGCLKFSNLIWHLDTFEEELAMARAYSRNNLRQTNRDKVIHVFRPVVKESLTTTTAKPAGEVAEQMIKDLRRAAGMKE